MDFAVLSDYRLKKETSEKINKYMDLAREVFKNETLC